MSILNSNVYKSQTLSAQLLQELLLWVQLDDGRSQTELNRLKSHTLSLVLLVIDQTEYHYPSDIATAR